MSDIYISFDFFRPLLFFFLFDIFHPFPNDVFLFVNYVNVDQIAASSQRYKGRVSVEK